MKLAARRVSQRANQRGSALLIVFVFAAMLAIMLYREMPVASFEAQRQKEELLIDRGNEYKRAIKLYVRKFQTFPASIEALENTNRMRFLRNRYVDPFSGKDDWRLLHAGPGGMILDSKIKQKPHNLNGDPNSTTGNNGFGNSGTSSASATDASALLSGQPAAGNAFPQRPPAVALNGGSGMGGNGETMPGMPTAGAAQDTQPAEAQNAPPVPSPGAPYPGYPGPPIAPIPGQIAGIANGPQSMPSAGMPDANGFPSPRIGRFRNGNPTSDSYSPGYPAAVNSPDPQAMMQALLNNTNPQPTPQTGAIGNTTTMTPANAAAFSGTTNQGNITMGGGIAGVASKSKGQTIKTVNDQTDRSLWEFVYDMRQEAMANAPGLGNGTGANNGINAMPGRSGTTPGINSPSQNSSFGNGFGSSGSQPTSTPQSSNQ